MKYLLSLFIILLAGTTAHAQYYLTHRQDTVRWFVGKWTDKNTFKIDSTLEGGGSAGGTITRNSNGGLSINTTEEKAFEDQLKENIKEIDQVEKQITKTNKEEDGLSQIALVEESIKELEKLKTDFKELSENKINKVQPKSDLTTQLESKCMAISPQYHQIIDFYRAHRKEKKPHFDLPAPPVADYFNCWSCDTAKQIEYDTLSARYVRNFYNNERSAVTFLVTYLQTMDGYGIGANSGDQVNPDIKEAFDSTKSHHGACSYIDYYEMSKAMDFYLRRGVQMADQLWEDNKTNYGALKPVLAVCLGTYQLSASMGVGGMSFDSWKNSMLHMAGPVEKFYDSLVTQLVDKRDYRLMGTIPFMLGLYQNIMGLSLSSVINGVEERGDNYHPKCGMAELFGFPHFELSIELDVKTGSNGSYVISHLKGTSQVIARRDEHDCVKFILGPKENEKITTNLITNEAISPMPHGVYVGTKTYTSQSPVFKINFCPREGVPDGDSLYLSTFVPLAPDKGNWNVQGSMSPMGINQTDRLFVNIDELKNDAQEYKPEVDQKKLDDIQKNALEMAEKIKKMQASGNSDPVKMAAMVQKMINNSGSVVETGVAEMMRIRLPLKVTNMDKMLVNQRFDAKEINPSMADAIVYAYLTIKLKHTPTHSWVEE